MKKKKICFVSLTSYSLLSKEDKTIGGAEVQQKYLADELKRRGFEVSFITYKIPGLLKNKEFKIFGVPKKEKYNLITYFFKNLCILSKMKQCNAEVFIYQTSSMGIVTLFSLINKCKLIKLLASDAELTSEKIFGNKNHFNILARILGWFDLKYSDVVISQNTFQKKSLKEKFGIESQIVKNPLIITKSKKDNDENYILWVGTIRKIKQPELFLKLAKKLPNYNFMMIGGKGENPILYETIKNKAKLIPNLEFIGFVPHHEIYKYYNKSTLLVNTSKIEGFPNIFLEAWMHFIPVISLNVDPDGIIKEYKLGFHSKNFDELGNNVNEICQNSELRQKMGENGRAYVEKEHDIKKIADKFEHILNCL